MPKKGYGPGGINGQASFLHGNSAGNESIHLVGMEKEEGYGHRQVLI